MRRGAEAECGQPPHLSAQGPLTPCACASSAAAVLLLPPPQAPLTPSLAPPCAGAAEAEDAAGGAAASLGRSRAHVSATAPPSLPLSLSTALTLSPPPLLPLCSLPCVRCRQWPSKSRIATVERGAPGSSASATPASAIAIPGQPSQRQPQRR